MKLFVVESPSKCGKIKGFLGKDYSVTASVGHIREIPPKGINIDTQNGFAPTFQISDSKAHVVKEIKQLASKAEQIILATDPDREGEAISFHLYDVLPAKDQKKCVRVTFDEITKQAVLRGIDNARNIDNNLVDAQKARQVLDRLIGYKVSPVLWFSVGRGTSAGRVQSIALKFICDREKEIKAFKPTDFWYVESLLQNDNGEFWAKVITKDKDNKFLQEKLATDALDVLKKSIYTVNDIKKQAKHRKPYPPFDTTTLQSACSSNFGWNATKTMKIAQGLYEGGKVSYIRSDSYNISKEALDSVRDYLKSNFDAKYSSTKPNVYAKKSSAAAQEAHECIRPTHVEDDGAGLESDAKKMYDLIRSRFIACQMSPMVVDAVTYTIKTDSNYTLIAKGQSIAFDGWFKVYKYVKADETILPVVKESEKLNLKDIKKTKHTTQPPKRYNDGSLILKMESEGVGRPSTRASILKSLQDKTYISKEKGNKGGFVASELGMRVCDYLEPRFNDFFMDVKYTASIEDELDLIANGSKTYLDVVQSVYDKLLTKIKGAKDMPMEQKPEESTGQTCSVCDEGEITGKTGRYGFYFSCNAYPKCKTMYVKDEDGNFKVKEKAASKSVGRKCPECGSDLVERKNKFKGTTFVGCSGFPNCRFIEKS